MEDVEAAAAAPPVAPAARRRAAAAETVADAVIYCYLGAMWAGNAAGVLVLLARYAVGWAAYAALVVRVARDVFIGALLAAGLLFPFTIVVLLLRIDRRQAEPAEHVLLVEGVYVTVWVHGPEHPAPRGQRQGAGYGLVPQLMFVFFSMSMLVGLLLQERLPASACWEDKISMPALVSDTGSFACSVMVMFVIIPYMLVKVRDLNE